MTENGEEVVLFKRIKIKAKDKNRNKKEREINFKSQNSHVNESHEIQNDNSDIVGGLDSPVNFEEDNEVPSLEPVMLQPINDNEAIEEIKTQSNLKKNISMSMFIGGFCCPWLWCISFLLFRNSRINRESRLAKLGLIILLCCCALLLFSFIIFWIFIEGNFWRVNNS